MKGAFSIAAAIAANQFSADAFPVSSRTVKTRASTLPSTVNKEDLTRPDLQGSSLIEDTLLQMEADPEFQRLTKKIARIGTDGMTREERATRRRALDELGVPNFLQFVAKNDPDSADADGSSPSPIRHKQLRRNPQPNILQLNIGLFCNQACNHCHVESSPLRKEETMSADIAARCLFLLQNSPDVDTLDLTGGAPELNGQFRFLVRLARQWAVENRRTLTIIDRCNLTVLLEPSQSDLVEFLKENQVSVVASLPCYGEDNVDAQRGRGVFQRSIAALLKLNEAGYGTLEHPELELTLVYNPSGPFLPPSQAALEVDYKRELMEKFGITFNSLLTITNMPIKRFADFLAKEGRMKEYMELLIDSYNPGTVGGLMCLNTVSVGWDGALYDCDFNQQLGMGIAGGGRADDEGARKPRLDVFDIDSLAELERYAVRTDNHCFGCTAGSGSSCQGATV